MIRDKSILFEHSKAKVELYTKYLSVYLNILSRATFINKIYLFDLFCGEGKDENDEEGSALSTLKSIKAHYFSNNKNCPEIDVLLNDSELSKIENGVKKIDRVKRLTEKIFKPECVNILYRDKKFSDIQSEVLEIAKKMSSNERALAFIDPWGYKEINPEFLKLFLANGKTEILLFLPINHMYRFANKSIKELEYAGGRPLRKLMNTLFDNKINDLFFASEFEFIDKLKTQLMEYSKCSFVDTFTIERSQSHHFCLFFLGNNKQGRIKILEAKWNLNKQNGRGFELKSDQQTSFFDNEVIEVSNFPKLITDFIHSKGHVSNEELFDFSLNHGYLPKHVNESLKHLSESGTKILVESFDGSQVRKNTYYINDKPSKKVKISISKN